MRDYTSCIADAQWQVINKFFDCKRKRKHNLDDIWNASQYVVRTGCQWRMLPIEFAPWQTAYYYFWTWKYAGLNDNIVKELVYKIWEKSDKNASPTVYIIDSQSVKTTSA